jgi:glycosyltransferase involved in cell wall biosynthesis
LNASERSYYLKLINREPAEYKTHLIPLATGEKKKGKQNFANNKRDIVVLCWWGTYIPLHGLEKIIQSADYLRNSSLDFELFIFGTSEKESEVYQQQINKLQLSDIVKIDNSKNFSDNSLNAFLVENCDLSFGNFGDSAKAKTVMVNKIVESASMALPIISQKTSALEEYFVDQESIYFCVSEPEKIAQKVIEIVKNRQMMLTVSSNAYQLYEKHFSKEAYIRRVTQVLDKALTKQK